jgi:hypothetical protein
VSQRWRRRVRKVRTSAQLGEFGTTCVRVATDSLAMVTRSNPSNRLPVATAAKEMRSDRGCSDLLDSALAADPAQLFRRTDADTAVWIAQRLKSNRTTGLASAVAIFMSSGRASTAFSFVRLFIPADRV